MHGEYKTPDGKLVAAAPDVPEGRLANVGVSGDFFLKPTEALGGIADALEGTRRTSRSFKRQPASWIGVSSLALLS